MPFIGMVRHGTFSTESHSAPHEVTPSPVTRYHAENRNVAHGEFKFGPVFMRLCYELGLEKMAAATLTDQVHIIGGKCTCRMF